LRFRHIFNEPFFSLDLIFNIEINSSEHEDVITHPEYAEYWGDDSDDAIDVIGEKR
jgi:hypothetical protein